ncbi:MAG: two-component system response regulator [Moraxellaceae bacterium]|nr:MAG: two-component system response regulator [Moraxellaceae bacterium]
MPRMAPCYRPLPSGPLMINGSDTQLHEARILIVSENNAQQDALVRALKYDGYHRITSAFTLSEAKTLYSDSFDLILLDMHFTGGSAFDVIPGMLEKASTDYLPLIIMTDTKDPMVADLILASGAKDVLGYPLQRVELLLRIRNVIQTHQLQINLQLRTKDLEEQLRNKNDALKVTQFHLIQCLGKAAEYRDTETGAHVLRIGLTTACLANIMDLGTGFEKLIKQASPMHDLGKISIPDSILLKPGKLDSDEWKIMKQHAVAGGKILSGCKSPLFDLASEIAECHHEKWDGSGYPYGLKAGKIPLSARITAICDVFDALLSVRPYKNSWTEAEACQYIAEQSGIHFDPMLVDAFLSNVPKIIASCEDIATH